MADDSIERWLPVVDYEGIYEVSDLGRVRRIARTRGAKPGRILRTNTIKSYFTVCLSRANRVRRFAVHTLVLEAFHGPRPALHESHHKNAIRTDNRADNLEWLTRQENSAQIDAMGHRPYGECQWKAKLTTETAQAIFIRARGGESLTSLASEYGVHIGTASDVIRGLTWRRATAGLV